MSVFLARCAARTPRLAKAGAKFASHFVSTTADRRGGETKWGRKRRQRRSMDRITQRTAQSNELSIDPSRFSVKRMEGENCAETLLLIDDWYEKTKPST